MVGRGLLCSSSLRRGGGWRGQVGVAPEGGGATGSESCFLILCLAPAAVTSSRQGALWSRAPRPPGPTRRSGAVGEQGYTQAGPRHPGPGPSATWTGGLDGSGSSHRQPPPRTGGRRLGHAPWTRGAGLRGGVWSVLVLVLGGNRENRSRRSLQRGRSHQERPEPTGSDIIRAPTFTFRGVLSRDSPAGGQTVLAGPNRLWVLTRVRSRNHDEVLKVAGGGVSEEPVCLLIGRRPD